ncbi:MAG: endoglucanase [Butyrivibrio sp.]|nr:endoglucanase [Acetatifactor muris]MCM1561189.1 endoglucanase [Butyrivibrio sp.]
MRQIPYQYRNLPIPGGGYVTGFLYSEREKDVLYIRTDIGGAYRFDSGEQRWVSLIPHVTMEDLSETFPIALAIDEEKPGSLYIVCGVNEPASGVLAVSEDYGESFVYEKLPVMAHGNLNGRGTGERLCVKGDTLFYASQQEGLWKSSDRGHSWEKLTALSENYLTFAALIQGSLLVGSAGVTGAAGVAGKEPAGNQAEARPGGAQHDGVQPPEVPMRGHSLYISYDGGESFEELEQPESHVIEGCRLNGPVAQRWCMDEKYVYVTFASTGRRSYVLENGYSCDSGDTIDGHVVRYPVLRQGEGGQAETLRLGSMEDVTPGSASAVTGKGQENIRRGDILDYGFSGVSVSGQTPGMLAATTIVKDDGDSVFLSLDYGKTWRQVLYDLEEGEISFRAPYMRPECNGGHSLIHWLSDIKINPFDDNEAWFNSGTGVFRTRNLKAEVCRFTDWCDGIEETVHLNVYSMPKGRVQVLDILGDLGGFAFEDLDRPCDNSFADAEGNRYITCMNADFSDERPECLAVTPRGNWTGKTFGGLILSRDQGRTFERLPMPFGLTADLDEALRGIERPNVNSGWVAMSPDCRKLVWAVADGIELPVRRLIASQDGGKSFSCCKVYDRAGSLKNRGNVKVFSDRTDSSLFYGFGGESDFYISHDGGQTYREYELPEEFPRINFGLIDCANKTEVRGETGRSGVFYLAVGAEGLWKLEYNKGKDETLRKPERCSNDCGAGGGSGSNGVSLTRLTAPGVTVYRMGLGLGRPAGDYYRESKAIYFNGVIDGQYGFYRTLDQCGAFERLNTDRQMFGEINSIDGDCRTFGRFYLATGSNGIKYGEQIYE